MASQSTRRTNTRRALLDAAAELFATQGVDGASIDAIAEAADRTSGAFYDHFGSKDGVLFALLEGWVDDVAAVVSAELTLATSLENRVATLWRNVSNPVAGGEHWIALEHELWRYASRNDEARQHLAIRYQAVWDGIDRAFDLGEEDSSAGPAVIGLLLGLEMMRRIDPDSVNDELAVAALLGVITNVGQRTSK